MKQVTWNKVYYDEFIRLTHLTDFQRAVMDRHIRRESNVSIAMALHCSESSVNNAIRQCKNIYDDVQPYSDILPVRRKGKYEK